MASHDRQPRHQELEEDLSQFLKDLYTCISTLSIQDADSMLDNTPMRQILTSMSGREVAKVMTQTLLASRDADANDYTLANAVRKLTEKHFFTGVNGMDACELFMNVQRVLTGEVQGAHLTRLLEWACELRK